MIKKVKDYIYISQHNVIDLFAKIKSYDAKHPHYVYIACMVFGLFVVVSPFAEDSVINLFKVYFKKKALVQELESLKNRYESDSIRLHQLKNDANALERVAREDYLMKSPNEIVFVLKKSEKNEE